MRGFGERRGTRKGNVRSPIHFAVMVLLILGHDAEAQRRSSAPEPIIDVHLHAHAADRFGTPGPPNPVTGLPSAAVTDDALLRAVLDAMRRYNIVVGVASSARASVLRWHDASPDRIIGGAQIDVGIPIPDLRQLREDIRAGRIGMIGEIGGQWLGLAPGDSILDPYFALAEELDVPVGIHMGIGNENAPFTCCPRFRAALGRPLLLEEVLIRHPRLRVDLMHAGYPYLDETIALMQVYPQVYVDLGAIDWLVPRPAFHRYLAALLTPGART